jgi:hypothetical protein
MGAATLLQQLQQQWLSKNFVACEECVVQEMMLGMQYQLS